MRIVYVNGGLGNQIFQYVFFRWLEVETGESCVMDDGLFFGGNVPHNGYELERIFGVRKKRLSRMIPEPIWQEMIKRKESGVGIAQQLLDAGNEIKVICEQNISNISFNGEMLHVEGTPEAVRSAIRDDTYYHGYWLGYGFWKAFEKVIRTELVFPDIPDGKNQKIARMMTDEQNSTAVHIRRGDMVKLGWATSMAWHREAAAAAKREWNPEHYYLFSDDLPWCMEHLDELGLAGVAAKLVPVDGNTGENAYIDMQLMSLCAHRLIPRSSFSLAAGMFCCRKNRLDMIGWGQ